MPGIQPKYKIIQANLHYLVILVLALASVPALHAVHLTTAVHWQRLISLYWIGFGLRSVAAACILALIGLPLKVTVRPVWNHFAAHKLRLFIFVPFVFWLFWKFDVYISLVWISVALVSSELLDRSYEDPETIRRSIGRVIFPTTYFFLGLILVSAYNDVAVAAGRTIQYDWLFLKIDSYLLHGTSISRLARTTTQNLSPHVFAAVEAIYYHMFDQVGAAIILISICYGTRQGARLVGTLLTAYFLSILIFCLWPSFGPFYTCPDHFAHFPKWLITYGAQRNILGNAELLLSSHRGLSRIGTDYFIAFPSMHIADPLIVLWFLRRWKRVVYCLIAYDIVMIPAILLLEWHYAVDLIGGAAVAIIAIWINNAPEATKTLEQGDIQLPSEAVEDASILVSTP